jgi:YD repeat-containing protein
MSKLILVLNLIVISAAFKFIIAEEPNYVRTKLLNVGKTSSNADADLVVTKYSDGLGKDIEIKTRLDNTKDRLSCSFFDNAGRAKYTTKLFIDNTKSGFYLPGNFTTINASGGVLRLQYAKFDGPDADDDPNAYSQTEYYSDPLARVYEVASPGEEFCIGEHTTRYWYVSVSRVDRSFTTSKGVVEIKNGFITDLTPSSTYTIPQLLDELSEYLLNEDPNPFGVMTHSLKIIQDPNGNLSQELVDKFGRKIAVRADASSVSADEIISEYEYGLLGELLVEKAPVHSPETGTPVQLIANTTYEYNPLKQLTKKISADGAEQRYEYDEAGRIIFTRSFKGTQLIRELKNNYDKFGRVISVDLCVSALGEPKQYESRLINIYDKVTLLLGDEKKYGIPSNVLNTLQNLKGRVVASIAVNKIQNRNYYITELFTYDDEGRVTTKYKSIPGLPMQKLSYVYDIQGKKLEEIFCCGGEIVTKKYKYNEQGLLKSIEHSGSTDKQLVQYNYNDLGQNNSKDLGIGAGFQLGFDYNIQDWLLSISSPATKGFDETISYAGLYNGNIERTVYKYKNSPTDIAYNQKYFYDQVNRLTAVSSSETEYVASYYYDEIGRFKSKVEGTSNNDDYQYYTNVNRLKKAKTSGNEYIYDEHGNLVIDLNKKMVIELDWRDMPVHFRFYNSIPVSSTQIDVDSRGSYVIMDSGCSGCDLYEYLKMCVDNASIQLKSTVTMLYDASGNRVLKMSK